MELEDIVYELACLHESMLFCCEDRFGKETSYMKSRHSD